MVSSSTSSVDVDGMNIDLALKYSLKVMGLESSKLKDGQKQAIDSFLANNDTLVVLPTGYGKSLVYQLVPLCCDYIQHARMCSCTNEAHIERKNIAVVISPLTALMSDQVKTLRARGINAINVAGAKSAEETLA